MKALCIYPRLLGVALFAACHMAGLVLEAGADETTPASPPHEGRIVHAWDGVTMWATIFDVNYWGKPNRDIPAPAAQFSQRILEEMIDEEAAAHVDAIAYCLYTAGWSDLPSSKITDPFPWRPPGMDEMQCQFWAQSKR